jgi:adenine-specific DNA methylase
MIDGKLSSSKYPSTRYSGSKRKLLSWIWENVQNLKFATVLDVFGGTGSVSLLFKRFGKQVFYNDLLEFNQIIGTAIIENNNVVVANEEVNNVLKHNGFGDPGFIQTNFKGIFFLDKENIWLDRVIANTSEITNKYKRAIILSSLFQACLAKRPFNLFHRANLSIRTTNVQRSFGNKTTWERPFMELLKRFVLEYNQTVFDNRRKNRVIGGYDAFDVPKIADLVYIDPPYFSAHSGSGTNYLVFYHFLEGLADYKNWRNKINRHGGKIKRMEDTPEIKSWTCKTKIKDSFEKVIERFQNSIIVLSYQNEGVPSKDEIVAMLKKYKRNVKIFVKPHRYALSPKVKKEFLFVAR